MSRSFHANKKQIATRAKNEASLQGRVVKMTRFEMESGA
jgi:hypothetical protein